MNKRDVIVIGASAGGVNALIEFVKSLPYDLDAAIFVVLHISASAPSNLASILNRNGQLKAVTAKDGEIIRRGLIYIAPPDHHLMLEGDHVLVKKGPKENRFRPSVDALFRSAAYGYGPRVIGIIMSGMLNDGTSGLWAVKRMGGVCLIQDPEEALFDSMPINALEGVDIDYILPVAEMGAILTDLVKEEPQEATQLTEDEMKLLKLEVIIAGHDNAFEMGIMNYGSLTPFTCPECSGALITLTEGKIVRFRCHTGHAFTASALMEGVTEKIEEKLWSGMRALEEAVMLFQQVGDNFKKAGNEETADLFLTKAKESKERAQIIHDSIFKTEIVSEDMRFNKGFGELAR